MAVGEAAAGFFPLLSFLELTISTRNEDKGARRALASHKYLG